MLNLDKVIPHTKAEIKQQQKLERIRHCENLRKERFFNAKNRLIGKDVEALDKQVEEKKLLKKLEDEENDAYYKQLMLDVQIADALENRTNENRKIIAHNVDIYRLIDQRKELSREYDLNDPKRVSNTIPMRFNDIIDPRELTKTSYLKFESEDYDGEKEKAIKKHLWQCLAKQITENVMNKNNYKLSQLQIGKDIMRADALNQECIRLENKLRTQAAKSTLEYNQRKAEYDLEKRKNEQKKENEDGLQHIFTCLKSDFYTENPEASRSALGRTRVIGYNYKGMSDEEKIQIKQIQMEQLKEIEEKKNIEKATEKYWVELEDLQTNFKFVKEQLDTAKRKEINKKNLEENQRLAAVQAVQKEVMKKNATDNFPTQEYFDAFNTTSR